MASRTVTIKDKDKKMVDIATGCCEQTLEESMQAHSALMVESRGNAQTSHSVVRLSAARKFNQEDPIETAAIEMILKKIPS